MAFLYFIDTESHRVPQLVVLILFQIGMIYGALNFWDQRTCRCMETVCCTEGLICFKFVSLFFLTN